MHTVQLSERQCRQIQVFNGSKADQFTFFFLKKTADITILNTIDCQEKKKSFKSIFKVISGTVQYRHIFMMLMKWHRYEYIDIKMFWYILKITVSKSFKVSFPLTYSVVINLKTSEICAEYR